MLSRFDTISERDRRKDRRADGMTEFLCQYSASALLCWCAIKNEHSVIIHGLGLSSVLLTSGVTFTWSTLESCYGFFKIADLSATADNRITRIRFQVAVNPYPGFLKWQDIDQSDGITCLHCQRLLSRVRPAFVSLFSSHRITLAGTSNYINHRPHLYSCQLKLTQSVIRNG